MNGPPTHTRRDRAECFGEVAELYDRARPGYPDALIDDLVAGSLLDVLDVGCGTGKAGRAFAARGCSVLGVEIDERMAEVARDGGLAVEVGSFESWQSAGRRFDLVVSGQAWHWVDPVIAPVRAAEVLRDGGRLAPFWNYFDPPSDVAEAEEVTAIYRREAPGLVPSSGIVGVFDREGDVSAHMAAIDACGRFEPARLERYHWAESFTTERWIDRLATQSEHRLLEPETRSRLFDALRRAMERHGGSFEVGYTTFCIVATKR